MAWIQQRCAVCRHYVAQFHPATGRTEDMIAAAYDARLQPGNTRDPRPPTNLGSSSSDSLLFAFFGSWTTKLLKNWPCNRAQRQDSFMQADNSSAMIIQSIAIYHVESLFQFSCSKTYHPHYIFYLCHKTETNSSLTAKDTPLIVPICTNMYTHIYIDIYQYVPTCAQYLKTQSNIWNHVLISFTKVKTKNSSQDVNDVSMVYLDWLISIRNQSKFVCVYYLYSCTPDADCPSYTFGSNRTK